MATIASESDRFPAADQDQAAAAPGTAAQPQPDSLLAEIPVVVHASHRSALPAEANRVQTVREETTTVLVFPRGAVVCLSAGVSRGALVVLTNQQNHADMLCRVVQVREQAGGFSYVELEFTQRAPAFWKGSAATETTVRSVPPVIAASAPRAPGASGNAATALSVPAPVSVPVSLAVSTPVSAPVSLPASAPVVAPLASVRPPAPLPPSQTETLEALSAVAAPSSAVSPMALPVVAAVPDAARASEADASVWRTEFAPVEPESADRETPLRSAREGGSKLKAWSHKPAIAVAGALLTVAFLFVEGYLLGHHRQPVAANSFSEEPAVRPTFPMQSAVARADERPPLVASAATGGVGAALSPAAVSTGVAKDTLTTDLGSKAPQSAQPRNSASPVATASAGASAAGSVSAGANPVGKMQASVAKTPRAVAASEPPPMLGDQGTAVAETLLASSALVQTSSPRSPAPAVAAANPEAPATGEFRGPKVISSAPPVYPDLARLQGLGGVIVVDATIDETGKVTDAKAVSGPLGLRQAAIDAVRRWKYQPAIMNGHAVAAHQTVNINFTNR